MNINSKTLIMVPVYNADKFITKTLDSCLNQTLKTEIWVVDNCSTDNTQTIVKTYQKKNTRIKLFINDKNYGRVGNWNKCLDLFMKSKFQYIKYVFSGDEIFPECIEESEKVFNIDNEIGAIAFPYEFVNINGHKSISKHTKYLNKLFSAKEITYINLAEGMLLGAIICNVYAKKAIKDFRFDENLISKAKFDIQVLEKFKAYYLDKTLARFNLNAHNTFDDANSLFVHMEFSYIEAKEHNRISKTNLFTKAENNKIEQRIIENSIKHQSKFMEDITINNSIETLLKTNLPNNRESLFLTQLNKDNLISYEKAMEGLIYQPLPWVGLHRAQIRGEATIQRWEKIKSTFKNIFSMKDIGCCVGYFCHQAVSNYNINAIGIDMNPNFIAIANHAKKLVPNSNKEFFHHLELNRDSINLLPTTDITILFSIWHHWVFHFGIESATKMLQKTWETTNLTLFFETGEDEVKEEFNLPFEGDTKQWITHYLSSILVNSKIETLGEFSSGSYSHYQLKIKRTLFKITRI
mgnify:CR=1 FL=1